LKRSLSTDQHVIEIVVCGLVYDMEGKDNCKEQNRFGTAVSRAQLKRYRAMNDI